MSEPVPEPVPPGLSPAETVHFQLLEKWRGAMDLVGPGPLAPHFIDAAAAIDTIGPATGAWLDLGSGAGFPGIALAARNPLATVLLVESRRKRATFLETVLAQAALAQAGLSNARVACCRSETLAGPVDGLVSRAYKAPEAVLADADRLLGPDGRAVLMLGDRDWEPPAGWLIAFLARYEVPDGARRVVVVQRG